MNELQVLNYVYHVDGQITNHTFVLKNHLIVYNQKDVQLLKDDGEGKKTESCDSSILNLWLLNSG